MADEYEALREKYKPSSVDILYIGESRPQTGKFFYNANSNLYYNTKVAYEQLFEPETFTLVRFMKNRNWLYDVCNIPVNGMGDGERKRNISSGIPNLILAIDKLQPKFIVVVKMGFMVDLLKEPIEGCGYIENSSLYFLPFPANGWQAKYRNHLIKILKEHQTIWE